MEYNNMLDDMKRMAKTTIQEMNWTPDEFMEQDYFEMIDILSVSDDRLGDIDDVL